MFKHDPQLLTCAALTAHGHYDYLAKLSLNQGRPFRYWMAYEAIYQRAVHLAYQQHDNDAQAVAKLLADIPAGTWQIPMENYGLGGQKVTIEGFELDTSKQFDTAQVESALFKAKRFQQH